MPKCSVCKKNYEFPEGLTFVHVDGRVLHFCSSKCRKNHEMGRKKLRWVTKQKGIDKLEAVEEESAKAEHATDTKQKQEKPKEEAEKQKPVETKQEKKADAK